MFLDRDGVLNESVVVDGLPRSPPGPEGVRISPEVVEACRLLRSAGLLLICVTNQPEVARGTLSRESLNATNEAVQRQLGLDALLVCVHDDGDGCDCRKPLPGLLIRASKMLNVDLTRSVMIGDRWRDVEAGRRAGCATIFVDGGYAEPPPRQPDAVVSGLAEAVPFILRVTGKDVGPDAETSKVDVNSLRVDIFADGADRNGIVELAAQPWIKGITTNPTLMRAAGVRDYEAFARDVIAVVHHIPISFEVIADDFAEMERQALRISQWGDNVYVKIPVTDTKRMASNSVIRNLAQSGVKLNITALFTAKQVRTVSELLVDGPPSFLSVFAGRIAEVGGTPFRSCVTAWESWRRILTCVSSGRALARSSTSFRPTRSAVMPLQ